MRLQAQDGVAAEGDVRAVDGGPLLAGGLRHERQNLRAQGGGGCGKGSADGVIIAVAEGTDRNGGHVLADRCAVAQAVANDHGRGGDTLGEADGAQGGRVGGGCHAHAVDGAGRGGSRGAALFRGALAVRERNSDVGGEAAGVGLGNGSTDVAERVVRTGVGHADRGAGARQEGEFEFLEACDSRVERVHVDGARDVTVTGPVLAGLVGIRERTGHSAEGALEGGHRGAAVSGEGALDGGVRFEHLDGVGAVVGRETEVKAHEVDRLSRADGLAGSHEGFFRDRVARGFGGRRSRTCRLAVVDRGDGIRRLQVHDALAGEGQGRAVNGGPVLAGGLRHEGQNHGAQGASVRGGGGANVLARAGAKAVDGHHSDIGAGFGAVAQSRADNRRGLSHAGHQAHLVQGVLIAGLRDAEAVHGAGRGGGRGAALFRGALAVGQGDGNVVVERAVRFVSSTRAVVSQDMKNIHHVSRAVTVDVAHRCDSESGQHREDILNIDHATVVKVCLLAGRCHGQHRERADQQRGERRHWSGPRDKGVGAVV